MVSGLAGSGWARRARARVLRLVGRCRRDESGATAIEFAIVALPFLMLLFGIMSVCLFYFANFSIENAVWLASRSIRTGQMQTSQGAYSGATTDADRKALFKKAMCALAPTFTDCLSKAVVIVQSNANFASISEPSCTSGGSLISDGSAAFNPGSGSSVVLVTVCYPWKWGGKLPLFKMGNLKDGSLLMQASVSFRSEPY
jgi:Flp pilus assembly protein TadG